MMSRTNEDNCKTINRSARISDEEKKNRIRLERIHEQREYDGYSCILIVIKVNVVCKVGKVWRVSEID